MNRDQQCGGNNQVQAYEQYKCQLPVYHTMTQDSLMAHQLHHPQYCNNTTYATEYVQSTLKQCFPRPPDQRATASTAASLGHETGTVMTQCSMTGIMQHIVLLTTGMHSWYKCQPFCHWASSHTLYWLY